MSNIFNIVIADDQSVVKQGISSILKELYNDVVIHQSEKISDIIAILNTKPIKLLLLDVKLNNCYSLNVIPTLKKIQGDLKILIFSSYNEDIFAIRFINAGANGFLNKMSSETEIKHAITCVMNTGKYTSNLIKEKIIDNYILNKSANPIDELSNREIEVANLLIEGYNNNEIAGFLNIQKTTVSTYKNRIFEKLSINKVSSLIQLFNFNNK